MRYIYGLIILLSGRAFGVEAFRADTWKPPVLSCEFPLIEKDRLLIFDSVDGTLKAFDIKSGMAQPKFLWQALGWGQGAGEIRKNSKVNSISVDPIGSEIVISHRWGVICLDQNGNVLKEEKRQASIAAIVRVGDQWFSTCEKQLRDRFFMNCQDKSGKAVWDIKPLEGIPLSNRGSFLNSYTELHYDNGDFVYYDASIGRLAIVDQDGSIKMTTLIKQAVPEFFTPETFVDDFEYGKRPFKLASLPFAQSGIVVTEQSVLLMTINFYSKLETENGVFFPEPMEVPGFVTHEPVKLLVEVDKATGKMMKRQFHPHCLEPLLLVAKTNEGLVFLNQDGGEEFFCIRREEFSDVKSAFK